MGDRHRRCEEQAPTDPNVMLPEAATDTEGLTHMQMGDIQYQACYCQDASRLLQISAMSCDLPMQSMR